MIDLISRQAALELKFSNGIVRRGVAYIRVDELVDKLKALPTIQPEKAQLSQQGTTSDPISRQAAVELVMEHCPDDDGAVQCDGDIRELLDELENLPPAQPEHDAEFWRKRAEEYSNICLAMTAEMTKGIKFNSIRIDENGICFGKEQPEQKWIPCSETVDIPDHEIMACDRHGEFVIGYLGYKDEQWICESDSSLMYDPVAWCELPKAYKEVTE